MSLDQAINHGHEHRKQYRGSKAIDKTCRNHGGCSWCEDNRLHKHRKKELSCEQQEDERYVDNELETEEKETEV